MNHPHNKGEPTPITDAAEMQNGYISDPDAMVVRSYIARRLEREATTLRSRITELEEALGKLLESPTWHHETCGAHNWRVGCDEWREHCTCGATQARAALSQPEQKRDFSAAALRC